MLSCSVCCAVRAGDPTRAPPATGAGATSVSGHVMPRQGQTCVPRPQNPTGSAWRIVKVHETQVVACLRGVARPEVVKPRPKPSPDLARTLPTSCRGLAPPRRLLHRLAPARIRDAVPPGGAAGIRTPDLRRARAALSQLSYGPRRRAPARSAPLRAVAPPHGWARLDSNQGPRPYQGRALTT